MRAGRIATIKPPPWVGRLEVRCTTNQFQIIKMFNNFKNLQAMLQIIQKEMCTVDYSRSAFKQYPATSKFAGHGYLALVLLPKTMDVLTACELGSRAVYNKNFFPSLNADGTINATHEAALKAAFDGKALPDVFVGRAIVPIPPTNMRNTAGQFVLTSEGTPKVYTSIQIVVLLDKDGNSVQDENTITQQADRIRQTRIAAGAWSAVHTQTATPDVVDDSALPLQ